jgi:dolichol kinase
MEKEYKRQIIHLLLGIIFLAIIIILEKKTAILTMILIYITGFLISIFHSKITPIPFLKELVKETEREHEKKNFGIAALNFTLSIIICSTIFYFEPKTTLIGAIIVLSFGDSISTIAGKKIGKTKIFGKTIEGTIAGIAISTIMLATIMPSIQTALAASTIGMLAEYLLLDDNFTIPIATGITIAILT